MTPLDLIGYLIAALMTAVALWRMPAALWGDEEDKQPARPVGLLRRVRRRPVDQDQVRTDHTERQ